MRVYCNRCDEKAIITTSEIESPSSKKLYCVCSNARCGHSFVMRLVFEHTLSPSALDLPEERLAAIQSGSRKDVRAALA